MNRQLGKSMLREYLRDSQICVRAASTNLACAKSRAEMRSNMNPKEIGAFLKELRNEKGITQEQLAEILGVSGRTVSRWETGNNLPDLSILVQIAEYYQVEIKEILNGERMSGNMNNELKETLLKVADYNQLEKERAAKAGNIAFNIMFLACAIAIIAQMLMNGSLSLVMGETAIFITGGIAYIFTAIKNGSWNGGIVKSTPEKDSAVSIACTAICSIPFCLILAKRIALPQAAAITMGFFLSLSALSYAILRGISRLSKKKADQLNNKTSE